MIRNARIKSALGKRQLNSFGHSFPVEYKVSVCFTSVSVDLPQTKVPGVQPRFGKRETGDYFGGVFLAGKARRQKTCTVCCVTMGYFRMSLPSLRVVMMFVLATILIVNTTTTNGEQDLFIYYF